MGKEAEEGSRFVKLHDDNEGKKKMEYIYGPSGSLFGSVSSFSHARWQAGWGTFRYHCQFFRFYFVSNCRPHQSAKRLKFTVSKPIMFIFYISMSFRVLDGLAIYIHHLDFSLCFIQCHVLLMHLHHTVSSVCGIS